MRESELKVREVRAAKVKDPGFSLVKECRTCECEEEHKAETKRTLALELVFGVGPEYKKRFHELDIDTVDNLAQADPVGLMRDWSAISPLPLSVQQLAGMMAHADSLFSDEPKILDRTQIPFPPESIVLDLEYSPSTDDGYIFLVGILVVYKDEQVAVKQEFAVDSADERRILEFMNTVLEAYSEYPIVTWSGSSADFPTIKRAWDRHGLSKSALVDFNRRHVDLYERAKGGVRLPIPGLGLKEVSEYFKFKREVPDVKGGLDALNMYTKYLSTKDERLRTKLMMYNEDDLNATLYVWHKLSELANRSASSVPS